LALTSSKRPRDVRHRIRQPPNAVPTVNAAPLATFAHSGRSATEEIRPSAMSSAAITPMVLAASFDPWVNASAPDDTHSARRSGTDTRRGARRRLHRDPRLATVPAAKPSTGDTTKATRIPITPTGRRSSTPPHCTASAPPAASAAPTRPPTSAWLELDGSASTQVARFHATAPDNPAATTVTMSVDGTTMIPAIVLATAVPNTSGPATLPTEASTTAGPGRAARVATSAAMAFAAS
jgi:hypothetical protein